MIIKLIDLLKRGYIILIVALIVLVKLMSTPMQTPTLAAGTKLATKLSAVKNCNTSSPSGGAYTVTPCFNSPADSASVSGDQTVSVTTTVVGINSGISKIVFYLNGQYLITDFQSPFTFVLPTSKWADGSQVLAVEVTMKDGFVSQFSSITLTFNNGNTIPPVNTSTFNPTSGTTPKASSCSAGLPRCT